MKIGRKDFPSSSFFFFDVNYPNVHSVLTRIDDRWPALWSFTMAENVRLLQEEEAKKDRTPVPPGPARTGVGGRPEECVNCVQNLISSSQEKRNIFC